MARPREFDVEDALDAAMEAFWDRGFQATSLADLMEATGLQKGSIYKAFGSKHELFSQALARYLDDMYAKMQGALEGPESAEEGVRRWLKLILRLCNKQDTRRGCFALNSVVELGPHDEATASQLRKHFIRVEKLLARAIARGQGQGEFRSDKSPQELADVLFLFAKGMLASSKGAHPKARLQRSANFALEFVR